MDQVKKLVRAAKEVALDYDDVQVRVRDATSNDPVGADERLLARISHDTRDRYSYNSMFSIFWKRLTDLHQPSHILKSLILCEYLLIHGDDRFVRDMRTKKNVIKRLTGYKFYREHEDVGGEVRNQARNVLRALTEDDLLEKLRKEKQVAALSRQGERYERTYTSQMQSAFSDSVQSPTNHASNQPNSPYHRPVMHQRELSQRSDADDNLVQAEPAVGKDRPRRKSKTKDSDDAKPKKEKAKKNKKNRKKRQSEQKDEEQASFASSLSDDDGGGGDDDAHVQRVTTAMGNANLAPKPQIDLLTGQGAAPVDWLSAFDFQQQHQQGQGQAPAHHDPSFMIESGGDIFAPTPIDPSTPQGTAETGGFAFDDALEIGSDDDADAKGKDGFWNVGSNLIDVTDLRAHAPVKQAAAPPPATLGKSLAEIAATNRTGATTGTDLAIRPLPQAGHNAFGGYPSQAPFGQPAAPAPFGGYPPAQGAYGYGAGFAPAPYAMQAAPFGGFAAAPPHQQAAFLPGMGYPPPAPAAQGQPFPSQAPFAKASSGAPAADPFAQLWKPPQ
ncbi:ENTH domain-containing protein [Plasmodiophora brassicae]